MPGEGGLINSIFMGVSLILEGVGGNLQGGAEQFCNDIILTAIG